MPADRPCGEAVEAFLAAVGEDPLAAWACIDPDRLRREADRLDGLDAGARARLPLFGTLVGVKDNFDTADLPTAYGSPIYAGHRPAVDAVAVARLREAGAIVAGKTALAEFASMHPAATVNPIDPERSPGGSSSGSAAAVAAGHVPVATGTQTAGSINRPASYCGVIGFKPTYGLIPVQGIRPLAPSLDTAGVLGASLPEVVKVAGLLAGRDWGGVTAGRPPAAPRIAFARTPLWHEVDHDGRVAIDAVARRVTGEELELEEWFTELVSAQATIQLYEGARALAVEREQHRGELSQTLRDLLDTGATIPAGTYRDALADRIEPGCELIEHLHAYDAVLTPSTTGVPPRGRHATGDPLFARAWNLIGAPSISLPVAWTSDPRLPVGLQLVGAPHGEERLLRAAAVVLAHGAA